MLRTHENRYAEQLDMVYKGNRLTKVSKNGDPNLEYDFQGYPDKADASTEMTYDPNGNMTADLDRGIVAIRYNLLNLPDTVQFENGNRIVYFYYAGGERAGAVTTTYSTPISVPLDSVYLGEDPHFDMWEHRHGNLFYKMGSPSRLLFDDGFFELAERHGGLISQIPYVFVRDHIGSVRLVCNVNTGEVVQSLEYLPSGVIFRSRNFDRQPYRFTGKELLSAHGLDWYDSGARMQEFHIPRFTTMDPLCEKYYSISPYAYCNNNPVNYVDPDGRDIWEIDYDGRIINRIENKTQDAFYMVAKDSNGDYQRTFSVDEDGNKKYNSINFEYGVITDSKKAWFFNQETSFSINNESDGANLFKFFANNTKIEFGLINTQNNGSLVMTNHQEHSIKVSKQAKRLSMNGATVTSIVHNHPNNSYPSGFRKKDNHGDKYAAALISNSKGYRVEHYVYQPQKGRLIMYDKNKIIGPIPWEYIFSSNK